MYKYYHTEILGKPFIFRQVLRKEYEGLTGRDKYEIETKLCKIAVADPEFVDWDMIEAGIPTSLSALIMKVSGFGDVNYINALINTEIERVSITPTLWLDSVIQHMYPQYSDDMLKELTMEETITLYAKSLYTFKYLAGEKVVIEANRIEEIRAEAEKHAPPKTPQLQQGKRGRNMYIS